MIKIEKSEQIPVSATTLGAKPVLDEVHSFVLRLHLNPSPGGRGEPRPQFSLEHVNQGCSKRMKNLTEVFEVLSGRIDVILQNADGGLN